MSVSFLLVGLIAPATATSNTAAANFPATNAATGGHVLKPWKATGVLADFLQIDLGASVFVAGVALNAANMNSVTVFADSFTPPTTNRGTLNLSQDAQGRYKGSLVLQTANLRYVRFTIAAGATNDGSSAWSIANALAFSTLFLPAKDPLYGGSAIDSNTPQSLEDLGNGVWIKDTTGPSFQTITVSYSGGSGDDHEQIQQYTRAGLCWLNLSVANAAWLQWPVRHYDPKITRKISAYNRELVDITLKEEV